MMPDAGACEGNGERRPQYPRRAAFFAHSATRLMLKSCLAQDIGPEGLALLVAIVHTEDAAHYRRPVTFFDSQLAPILGLRSWKVLHRVRQAAVTAGWLHYEPGRKGKAGVYWLTVPERLRGIDDCPSDEGGLDEFAEAGAGDQMHLHMGGELEAKDGIRLPYGGESAVKTEMHLHSGGESGDESGGNGRCNGRSFNPVPDPHPKPKNNPPPPCDNRTRTGIQNVSRSEQAEALFAAYPRKVGKGAALKAISKALAKVSFEALREAVEAFAAARAGQDQSFTPYPATWFNEERWNDDRAEWARAAAPARANGHSQGVRIGPGLRYDPQAVQRDPEHGKW